MNFIEVVINNEIALTTEIEYKKSNNILEYAKIIIESAQNFAYKAVNIAIIQRNWFLGKRIAEEDFGGEKRAAYGKQVIRNLSDKLTDLYGKGFDASNLYKYLDFYQSFQILDTVCLKSLSWSHFRTLLQVEDKTAREWYAREASSETWSVRTLQRNISSQYYERTLLSQHKQIVKNEMHEITKPLQDKLEFIKNPMVAEFLGLSQNTDFTESKLEAAIITNIQKFLMELGKGYAFVARQQHIHTEKEDYYIDLVFYNYILKCFVLIDLKTSKVTHQDVGQMDMYVRMYDDLKRSADDNPTLGVILCTDTDENIAKYSILHGNEKLFATKYKLYLPDEVKLKAEIEAQKEIFKLQHDSDDMK